MGSQRTNALVRKSRITLLEIAEATGLSRTTVCDILHRDPKGQLRDSVATCVRVLEAVQRLGTYRRWPGDSFGEVDQGGSA